MSEHKERVKVVNKKVESIAGSKGSTYVKRTFTFEFSDGSTKDIKVPAKQLYPNGIFDLAIKNDMGILTYHKWRDKITLRSFENDNYSNKTKLSLYEKLYKMEIGTNLLIIIYCLLSVSLATTLMAILFHYNNVPPKQLLILLILVSSFAITALVFYIPWMVANYKLKNMPEKKDRVKVLSIRRSVKGEYSDNDKKIIYVLEFPDGSRKCVVISRKDFDNRPRSNGTGILIYKERGNQIRFVGYERNK